MSILDKLIFGIRRVFASGFEAPTASDVNFVGASATYDSANDRLDITITGGGGVELSDSPARSIAVDSLAGTSPKASRSDHVHAHGDLAGGTLHDAVTTEAPGFATPQMLLDIADLTDAIAALPSTYSPIGHTHDHGTLSGLTTGDPHTQYVLRTDGSVSGNSNTYAIRDGNARLQCKGIVNPGASACDVFAAKDIAIVAGTDPGNTLAGITMSARGGGIKLQVNDATTPATVRTVLEIVREADGVGTADRVYVDANFGVLGIGAWFNVQTATGRFTFDWTDDDNGMSAYWDHVNGFRFGGAPVILNASEATAGQLRTLDGEVLNAKGSTGAEVCLVSYDKTLTSAIFGSDGAGSRQTATSVLAGSTSAQLVVGSASQLEARADHVKANTQIACAVKTATVTTTTTTLDCATGNVHSFSSSNTTTCTVSLSNTKAGAEVEMFVTKAGSGLGITLSPTWFDMIYSGQSNVIPFSAGTGGTTIHVRGRVLTDGGKVFVTDARAT